MNYEDRPTLAAWNEKCSVIAGTYQGDGASTRIINLGVTPKAVIVVKSGYKMWIDDRYHGGIAVTGYGTIALSIVENGFQVAETGNSIYHTNENGYQFQYIALY